MADNISASALRNLFASKVRVRAMDKLLTARAPSRFAITGIAGSAPSLLFSAIPPHSVPLLIVADDYDDAGYIYNDLCNLIGEQSGNIVHFLPSGYRRHIKYGQADAPSQILRTETLNAVSSAAARWIVTYPAAIAEKVPAPEKLDLNRISLKKGERTLISDVTDRLLQLGFTRTDYVYEPGQYARRGSILDIFSYSSELPFRLDFFDDEIDSIRSFNVETQLSEQKLESVDIVGPDAGADADSEISFLDFLPEETPIVCRNIDAVLAAVKEICSSDIYTSVEISGEGETDALKHLCRFERFEDRFLKRNIGEFTPNASASFPAGTSVLRYDTAPQALYHKNFELISDSFSKLLAEGYKLHILSEQPKQSERLRSIFADRGDEIRFTAVGIALHEGFLDRESKICYFTDHQIFDRFHKFNLRSERARQGKLALSLKELGQIETGDYIVHMDHGVGRFGGLVRTNVGGTMQEMIKLVYAGDDIIFASIHALHKLSKYRGKEGVPPKVNKLGSGAWNRLKERTKTKMKDIARDLIKLYAERRREQGFSFSPDSYMQHELEASFAFEDTPDQLAATKAVKADMESSRPMDRLICGDVGFGKTEIAVRAAFKAAVDGKQTAVLVPTTVLALQHYHTFSERLKDMPVKVDFLSRARKATDVKKILSDLKDGKIDILIGTHKLIGKQVVFHDLGLLVVDEEQKFGVAVKEKLKQLKVNVDTLTMSATPIPRTLQFSLMGARDLSNLNTPPANRHPIVTSVSAFSEDIVEEAVNFEISRGGQVFIVANRIESHATLRNMVERLVPGARIVEAHGQMPPEKLENAVCGFADGDFDVLISTTIIESGIDMPNVNTIIIDNAQNFGLSELHQLRGRVGRSSRKAFCYMLTPPGLPLTPVARRRLQAIESFSDLGSGIHIAMQDLDIRGAGNLLGAEQSGFIADLGYEAYQKILKESVFELRTEEFSDTLDEVDAGTSSLPEHEREYASDCMVETDLELLIPASYVPQEGERISLYQELDGMETPGCDMSPVDAYRDRLRDRFGAIPRQTEELIRIVPLRASARRLGIEKLYLKQGCMFLYFVGDENRAYYKSPAFGRVLSYMQMNPRRTRLREKGNQRSMVIEKVTTVEEALGILHTITSLPSL